VPILGDVAYRLLESLRRLGLPATELASATSGTIRRKLFKIGALVTVSVRGIKFAMASGCPYQDVFAAAYRALGAA
jgi:Transposase DDE domain group 1